MELPHQELIKYVSTSSKKKKREQLMTHMI